MPDRKGEIAVSIPGVIVDVTIKVSHTLSWGTHTALTLSVVLTAGHTSTHGTHWGLSGVTLAHMFTGVTH